MDTTHAPWRHGRGEVERVEEELADWFQTVIATRPVPEFVATTVRQLRERYQQAGYEIVEHPRPEEFPFEVEYDLVYRPTMLARRGDEHHVFEIRETVGSIRRLTERAQEIRARRTWRFYVISSEDVIPTEPLTPHAELLPWWRLEAMVEETMHYSPSLPGWIQLLALWAVLEGVLRRIALNNAVPVEMLPAYTLVGALHTYGLIPYESYQPLKAACEVHRRVRHGYETSHDQVSAAVKSVSEWLPTLMPTAAQRAA